MARPLVAPRGLYYGWVITGTFFVLMVASWGIAQGSFGAFVNPMTQGTGWSRTEVSAAFSTSMAVSFFLGVFWGWLADRWSIRWVVGSAGMVMGLGVFLASTADTLWQLYLFYGLIGGVGLGGSSGPMAVLAMRWFERRRALAISLGYAGSAAGTAAMVLLANYLATLHGWQFGFRVLGFIIWATFLAGIILLKDPAKAAAAGPEPVDAGTVEEDRAPVRPLPGGGPQSFSSSIPSLTLAAAMRTRSFWLLFGMIVTAELIFTMILVHLVPRATDQGMPASTAVTLITIIGILKVGGMLGGGALGDRIGHRRVYIIAMILQSIGLLWLTLAGSLWMFYVFAAIFGFGNGGWSPQVAAIAARTFGTRHIGAIFGAAMLGAGIGGFAGPIIAGYIFDTTGSYRIAFSLVVGFALVGALLAFLLVDGPRGSRERLPRPG